MRKLIFIFSLVMCSVAVSAQTTNPFPTTDSLRKFINKWIRNSAVDAFTSLRLNTALIGMSRFIDSSDANAKLDISDTAAMLAGYTRVTRFMDSVAALRAAIGTGGGGISPSDTAAMLNPYLRKADTAAMLAGYTRVTRFLDSLTAFRNRVLNKADTAAMLSGYKQKTSILGTLYAQNSWTSGTLASDFTNRTATVSVVSNKLRFTGGANTWTQTLELNRYTDLEDFDRGMIVKVEEKSGVSHGFAYGVRSTNGYNTPSLQARFNATTGGNSGLLYIIGGTGNSTLATSASALSFSQNDFVFIRLRKKQGHVEASVRNITTNSDPVTVTYDFVLPTVSLPNTGRTAIYSIGGQFLVDSIYDFSTEIRKGAIVVLGDSKVQGYSATATNKRWSSIIEPYFGEVVNLGGGYDRTTELLTRVQEVIDLAPRLIILQIPSNDPRSGVDNATSQANYLSIVNSFRNAGIPVLHLTPAYETSIDLSTQYSYIKTTFSPDSTIDIWYDMQQLGSLYSDGIHPADLGHVRIANKVIVHPILAKYGAPNKAVIQNQTTFPQDASFNVTGESLVQNQLTVGDRIQGEPQLTVAVGADHQFEFAALGGIPYLYSLTKARNTGQTFRTAGNPWTAGIFSGTYTELLRLQATGTRVQIGDETQGIGQLHVKTYADGRIESAASGDTNFIRSINAAGNAGKLMAVGANPLVLGHLTSGPFLNPLLTLSSSGIKMHSLTNGGGSDSVLVVNGGIVKRVLQSSISGGTPSLTSNYIGYGVSGSLSGTSSYQFNGTTVTQEASGASNSIISTTAVGASSGGAIRLFAKATPTAADQLMGAVQFGTLDGGSTENITASIRAYANGAHTPGSSEPTNLRFYTSAAATESEVMRLTHNLRVGIGVTSPTARLHLPAGNASAQNAPLKLSSGTNMTTPEAGAEEYDGTSRFFTPGSTRLRYTLTDNSIPSNGQIPIGNGNNYTNATLTQGTGISVTNGSGSITVALNSSYIAAGDYTPTLTGVTNVDAVTLIAAHYIRVGDQVTVDIAVNVDPTSISTLTNFDITLPIASTMTNATNLTGIITSGTGGTGNTIAFSNNARTGFEAMTTSSQVYNIHFMYRIQ